LRRRGKRRNSLYNRNRYSNGNNRDRHNLKRYRNFNVNRDGNWIDR
jgi:hypothetical protein